MKKLISCFTIVLLITCIFTACGGTNELAFKEPYIEFLHYYESECTISNYAFKDLDNNGTPEIIIINSNSYALETVVEVYTFTTEVVKLGEYSNPTGKSLNGFRYSNNSKFPGIFEYYWGYGVDHYRYIYVKDGKVLYEELWNEYHNLEPKFYEKVSSNNELIKEAESIYADINSQDGMPLNQLEVYNMLDGDFEMALNLYCE